MRRILVGVVLVLMVSAPTAALAQYTPGSGQITVSPSTVEAGGNLTVTASGFADGARVEIFVQSDPVLVGTAIASQTGTISAQVQVPSSIAAGAHTLKLVGAAAGGGVLELTQPITVLAAQAANAASQSASGSSSSSGNSSTSATTTSSLPTTGAQIMAMVALGVGLVGGGTILVRRTRGRPLTDRQPVATPSPEVSVVLPCLDEEASVGLCVTEALDALDRAGLVGEVVVVDNGSTDRSAEVAVSAGARVVDEPVPGYGAALRRGFAEATGDVVVMADADHTYPLDRIAELVVPVLDGSADLVLGARLDAATRHSMPLLHRWVGTPVLSFLNRRAAPELRVTDSQSGYRAFRRSALPELGLRSTGMELASEMLISASHRGWRIDERPLGYRPRIGESKLSTFRDGWRHLQLILISAPDLLLVGPGALLAALGLLLGIAGLVVPAGVQVGSLTWQPVFFSTIALVSGTQMALAGVVMANRSAVVSDQVHRRFAFVGNRRFSSGCLAAGAWLLGAGLVVDVILFAVWLGDNPPLDAGLALAGLAQSLIIIGMTFASFGLITGLVQRSTATIGQAEQAEALAGADR